jgi:eukaryotic-like serine/threonine-protein kinase
MRNSSPIALGQVIANKYQVEGVLGEGGMGIVVSAWHLGLEQRVAIKLLLSHMRQTDSSALERFQREARAAARIRSEHVCRVLDTGHLDDGTPFLVMEYLEGADLADELVRRGRFEIAEAVRYVREACQALQQAHQAGVIHRDLKPANLYLVNKQDGGRMIKVLDFGVSKSISSTGAPNMSLTKTSALVGSPIYMSPEQLNSSKDVDGRTDIWALGIILYELITGRTPFYGESIPQLVNSVLNTEPDSFAKLGINAPAGLEQVVRRALTKSRDGRYGSAQELYQALAPFATELSGSTSGVQSQKPPTPTRSMSMQDGRPSVRPSSPAPTPPSTGPKQENKRLRMAALVVFLIGAAGVAAVLSRRVGSEPEPAAVAPAAIPSAPSVPSAPKAQEVPPLKAPEAEPPTVGSANPSEPSASAADAASLANQPATTSAAAPAAPPRSEPSETHRRERARPKDSNAPTAAPLKPESSDDSLPNFGGRR